jgi:hypothetical protein
MHFLNLELIPVASASVLQIEVERPSKLATSRMQI